MPDPAINLKLRLYMRCHLPSKHLADITVQTTSSRQTDTTRAQTQIQRPILQTAHSHPSVLLHRSSTVYLQIPPNTVAALLSTVKMLLSFLLPMEKPCSATRPRTLSQTYLTAPPTARPKRNSCPPPPTKKLTLDVPQQTREEAHFNLIVTDVSKVDHVAEALLRRPHAAKSP